MIRAFNELNTLWQLVIYLSAFGIVAVAAGRIATVFRKLKLPLITGFLAIGLLSGPDFLGIIHSDALERLSFINDLALAFIAFAVGSELYMKELRRRMKSIIYMLITQTLVPFVLVSLAVFLVSDMIPFMQDMMLPARLAVSMFAGVIAAARSPASAIAVINEFRARGPFTQTSIGVIVVKDFGVIVVFAVIFTLSKSMIQQAEFRMIYLGQAMAELLLAFGFGFLIWLLFRAIFSLKGMPVLKKGMVLLLGFLVYLFTRWIANLSSSNFGMELHIEPLLICIVGSFLVTNYSIYRNDFVRIIKDLGPMVYVMFFTLTGAKLSLGVLATLWFLTLIIFGSRMVSLFVAGYTGSILAGDSSLFRRISWMPYVTQAGVAMGLATIIAVEYPGWGEEFTTVILSVIILNLLFGPLIFRWALHLAGEVHVRSDGTFDVERKVLIFGWENQSLALARQLKKQSWKVEFVVTNPGIEIPDRDEFPIHEYKGPDHMSLRKFSAETADTLLCLLSDEENYRICETAYEHLGTKHLIVRLSDREYYKSYQRIGAMVMDPATAMVSLMEHFVRSPIATSLLLGMDEGQDTIDIEVRNSNYHGLTLRDLRLPSDVIILSVTRGDHPIISHGYTRLRLGDIVTMVGSNESLDKVRLNIQGY